MTANCAITVHPNYVQVARLKRLREERESRKKRKRGRKNRQGRERVTQREGRRETEREKKETGKQSFSCLSFLLSFFFFFSDRIVGGKPWVFRFVSEVMVDIKDVWNQFLSAVWSDRDQSGYYAQKERLSSYMTEIEDRFLGVDTVRRGGTMAYGGENEGKASNILFLYFSSFISLSI